MEATQGLVTEASLYFYDSLINLAGPELELDKTDDILQRVEQNQLKLRQNWAHYAPMNYQHKSDLVEAEKCRVLGKRLDAIDYYDCDPSQETLLIICSLGALLCWGQLVVRPLRFSLLSMFALDLSSGGEVQVVP